jgi:hypothetical protein
MSPTRNECPPTAREETAKADTLLFRTVDLQSSTPPSSIVRSLQRGIQQYYTPVCIIMIPHIGVNCKRQLRQGQTFPKASQTNQDGG